MPYRYWGLPMEERGDGVTKARVPMVGKTFGRLTVVEQVPAPAGVTGREAWYRCTCQCGGRDHHPGHQPAPGDHPELRLSAHPRTDDLTGQRFGRLTVLALTEARGSNGGAVWQCQCDYGEMVQVHAHKLKCGHTRSCGCAHQDGIRNLQG